MSLSESLRAAIRDRGWTYAELERKTGVCRASILRFMRHEQSIQLAKADLLCEFLDLELRQARTTRKGKT